MQLKSAKESIQTKLSTMSKFLFLVKCNEADLLETIFDLLWVVFVSFYDKNILYCNCTDNNAMLRQQK
jgi:hypothetical protein